MNKLVALVVLVVVVAAAVEVHAACSLDTLSNPAAPALVVTSGSVKQTYLDNNRLQVFISSSQQYKSASLQFLSPGTTTYGVPECDFNWIRPAVLGDSNSATNTNNNWSPSASSADCSISFTGIWPAANVATTLAKCFTFDNVTDSTHNIYTADVRVTTQQDRPAIRGLPIVKVTVTNMKFSFRFQRVVTVNTNQVSVTGSVSVIATVVEQIYNRFAIVDDQNNVLYPAGSTTVRLVTSVQYPYFLTYGQGAATVNDPTNYGVSNIQPSAANAANVFTNCSDIPGTICYQVWEVSVTPKSQICSPSATIGFAFTVTCQPGYQGNCVTAANAGYTTSYALTVSDTCNQVVEDIGLTGYLTSYASFTDISNNKVTNDYIYDQTAFFLATLTPSAGSPNLLSSAVTQVSIQSVGSPVVFTDPVSGPNPNAFTTISVGGRPGFSFLVNGNTVALSSIDAAQSVTITATITVTYANLQSETKVLSFPAPNFKLEGTSGLSLSSNVIVSSSSSSAPSTASSSSTLLAIVAGVVGGCVLVAIVAGVIIYRRTTQRFVQELQGQSVKVMQVYMPAANSSSSSNLTASAPASAPAESPAPTV